MGGGHGAGVEVFLLRQAGVPQVAVAVDETGQYVFSLGVDDPCALQRYGGVGQHGDLFTLHAHVEFIKALFRVDDAIFNH